ncbi:MAG: succinate dehydrogenase cytochrome b subunit [Acidobacteriota bacterium]
MTWILEVYRSPMVKKAVMAVTGVILFGFVVVHLAGNLKMFQGPEKINAYAVGLKEIGVPLLGHGDVVWLTRFALLAAVGLHMLSAWQLTLINRKARPVAYAKKSPQAATYASRTMRWGGVIVILFVIYHLLHLTVGSVHSDFKHGDLYHNVVVAFSNPLISGFYILAITALGFHLYHGLWSLFQSLGWNGPRFNVFRKQFAMAFAILVTLGFISIPVSVLAGILS